MHILNKQEWNELLTELNPDHLIYVFSGKRAFGFNSADEFINALEYCSTYLTYLRHCLRQDVPGEMIYLKGEPIEMRLDDWLNEEDV